MSSAERLYGKKVFTTFEVARICDVTPVTIQNWIDKGWLGAYRTPGGHRRVCREELLSFLESRNIPHAFQEHAAPARVLIVDGASGLADSIREALLLDGPGYDVQVARDGFHAGCLYARMNPDVVILDWNHPEVDGYEACRRMRENGADTPVLLVGGHSDGDGRERVLGLGAVRFLPKPVDAAGLRSLVRASISNRAR